MGVKETALYAVGAVASQCKKNWINFNLNFQRYCITVGNNVSKHYKVYISIYSKYCTSYKETCRMIPRLTLDSRHGGLCVLFFLIRNGQYACVSGNVCMCVASSSYLFLPGHSADIHSKEPLVVIHGNTQPGKMSPWGEGERQSERNTRREKAASGESLKPNKQPRYLGGVPLSFLLYLILPAAPPRIHTYALL